MGAKGSISSNLGVRDEGVDEGSGLGTTDFSLVCGSRVFGWIGLGHLTACKAALDCCTYAGWVEGLLGFRV